MTGTFPITVRATDSNGCIGARALTLTVVCPTITGLASNASGAPIAAAADPAMRRASAQTVPASTMKATIGTQRAALGPPIQLVTQ